MTPDQANRILTARAFDYSHTYYGNYDGLALGAGLIVDKVEIAFFDSKVDRFAVISGPVLVLSHECDIDRANERLFNDMVLVCPILSIEPMLVDAGAANIPDTYIGAFLGNLAGRAVSRAVYMPPIADLFPIGGLMYLNRMTSTALARLEAGQRVCAVSAHGLTTIDYALENHLRRPKSDRLPLASVALRKSTTIVSSQQSVSGKGLMM